MSIVGSMDRLVKAFEDCVDEISNMFDPADTTPDRKIGDFEYVAGSLRSDYEEWTAENDGYPFAHEDLLKVIEYIDIEVAFGLPDISVIFSQYDKSQQDAARELRQNLYNDLRFANDLDRQWSGEPEAEPVVIVAV